MQFAIDMGMQKKEDTISNDLINQLSKRGNEDLSFGQSEQNTKSALYVGSSGCAAIGMILDSLPVIISSEVQYQEVLVTVAQSRYSLKN